MSAKDFAPGRPVIQTQAELDHLSTKSRASGPTYEMDGPTGAYVRQVVDLSNEQRRLELKNKLEYLKTHVRNEHAVSNVRDRARADFERSR